VATPKSSLEGINPLLNISQSPASILLSKTERESPKRYIKQEQKEEPNLFIQQPQTPAKTHCQSNVVDLESTPGQGKKREPLRFNKDSYIAPRQMFWITRKLDRPGIYAFLWLPVILRPSHCPLGLVMFLRSRLHQPPRPWPQDPLSKTVQRALSQS
jgi:hypothetical protein